jgi:hypothetical protein
MIMKVVFPDGSWVKGNRNQRAIGWLFNHESSGTHHMFVLDGSPEFHSLIGREIAVSLHQTKYSVLNCRKD